MNIVNVLITHHYHSPHYGSILRIQLHFLLAYPLLFQMDVFRQDSSLEFHILRKCQKQHQQLRFHEFRMWRLTCQNSNPLL